jgi:(1->4)-alpha-D-glucan 1-alpha-D-glucosylmutase
VQARIPLSTYRFQFNNNFTFEQANSLVNYLNELGVSDCYSSPILKARHNSSHGYDVIDHSIINPELGGEESFINFARNLKQYGMGLVIDVVPNHMCIADNTNNWWLDVLENGPSSPFASYFDIDWHPPKENLVNKVLLPFLGDQYGRVLENQEIRLSYRGGAFYANYYETSLPVSPRSTTKILELALDNLKSHLGLDESQPDILELESIITALSHLPPRTEIDPAKIKERRRETAVTKRRLANLVKSCREVRHSVHNAIEVINGVKNDPRSFDLLEELLANQAYRLSYWRVAADEINYRRFFDINDLAAIRVENRPVFIAVHEIIFRLMKQGLVTGLRIDHVDGLFNPQKYLSDLQRSALAAFKHWSSSSQSFDTAPLPPISTLTSPKDNVQKPCYIIVEKILSHDELLRSDFAVYGTTGYEFMNILNGVFVDHTNAKAFKDLYSRFTGITDSFSDVVYASKRLILRVALSSELHVLARKLDRISEQHRWSRDFTLNSLQHALSEVIACFPVYRTYTQKRNTNVSQDDKLHIRSAIQMAKRRNPAVSESIFNFIENILLLDEPKELDDSALAERRDFVLRLQQLTAPVMAKGFEDTAFYRFYPLASLNEVGGEPNIFGIAVDRFHRKNLDRFELYPHSLSATSTHDTKRSEDVRARINVLSELPTDWESAIHRWQEMNRGKKVYLNQLEAPDANEEYLLYQTLLGAWPLEPLEGELREVFIKRIEEYINKALKEAKIHTSWVNPNEEYDGAVRNFIRAILEDRSDNYFLDDFKKFCNQLIKAGLYNSLSQTLLKITLPGVPDFYQGTELWDFSLVDPDNRRPVDYEHRINLLNSIRMEARDNLIGLVDQLISSPEDGRIKMFISNRALEFRRENRELFEEGEYLPLYASGEYSNNLVAFARESSKANAIVVVARFYTRLGDRLPIGKDVWGDTFLNLREGPLSGRYRDLFTNREIDLNRFTNRDALPLSELFTNLPVVLLERV